MGREHDLRVSRRGLLGGVAGVAGVAGAAGAGFFGGRLSAAEADDAAAGPLRRFVPFEGEHQAGITARPVPSLSLMAAFDCVAPDADALAECLQELTDEIRALMAGEPVPQRDAAYPPVDSGLLGEHPPADNLSVVVSVGASLFDDRYGLADRRPSELVEMPFIANDRLDPARSHGDLLLTIEAEHPDTVQFALRQLMRRTREWLVVRWVLDGWTRGTSATDGSVSTPRNLMGFKDGTANLDTSEASTLDELVWVDADADAGAAEPDWMVGGSYHVVRVIRLFVEFWDRTPLAEQEAVIGRHKLTGAPLGMRAEADVPDFGSDPAGDVTPLTAHIRLANPRTERTRSSLLLRRGFSYSRGFDGAGNLDQGLAFVCYQRSLATGFLAVQERLRGEPLEEYTLPEGGGFYFALPGVSGPDRYLGDLLLA